MNSSKVITSFFFRLLLIPFLFVSNQMISQITVDDSLSTQQIIEDVLINNSCAEVSNFSSSTGTNFGDVNGIGVFDASETNFPFEAGVILSSGNVLEAPGPNSTTTNAGGGENWPGDTDLENNTNATQTFNASFIEFDFIPIFSTINFNFLMASEEYNQNFECSFSDAFAFILTDQVTGESQNLAVLPNTNTPIQVTNIHPFVPPNPSQGVVGCPAINEEFFDTYNFSPFNNEASAINYDGQTVSLTATGEVIIGNTYTIKLVVADATDSRLDTAIFLEANSFNLGIDLGEDLTIENGNAPCEGSESFEIGVTPDESGTISYQWSILNPMSMLFEAITGETSETLFVSEPGTYQITATFSNGCSTTDAIVIEYFPQPIASMPNDYIVCDTISNDGITLIDFTNTTLITEILNGQDPDIFNVTFYDNLIDAQNATNPLPINGYENTTNPQTIIARVTAGTSNCFALTNFTIEIKNAPLTTLPEIFRLCLDIDGNIIAAAEGNPSPPIIETGLSATENNFSWFLNGQLLSNETNPDLTVNQAGTYSVVITNVTTQCSNEYTTTVFTSSPPINVSAKVISNAFASNNIIEVSAEGSNAIVYSLDGAPFQENNIFENVAGGSHTITVKDNNGCGITTLSIFVLFYQRLLTPNNDGYHDTWNLDGLTDLDPNASITIFDRFGKFITRISPSSSGWDGTYNGRPLYANDYWFRAEYIENEIPKTFRGHITLKR